MIWEFWISRCKLLCIEWMYFFEKYYFIYLFLATLHSMWDLSSQTKDQTCVPAMEAWVLAAGPPWKSQNGCY